MLKKNLSVKQKELLEKKLYFNFVNSSQEFKSIFNNYKKQNNIKENKKISILYFFDNAMKKAINKESEEEFMFKDLQKLRKINNELLNQYGEKSKKEYHAIKNSKFDSKLSKGNFIDIFDDNLKKVSTSINANKEIKLPNINQENSIFDYKYIKKDNSFNKEIKKKTNINNLKNKNHSSFFTIRYNKNIIENLKKSKINNFNNSNNNQNEKIFNNFKINNKSVNNSFNNCPTKKRNKSSNENITNKYISSSNDTSLNTTLNYTSLQKPIIKKEMSFIETLDNMKNNSIREEKIYKYLFFRHNKKSIASNQKYNFMMQKYFS